MKSLTIALQKGGRLNEESLKLLRDCGIRLSVGSRKLKSEAQNFPLEILYLRDDDIPQYVEDGIADAGILGLDVIRETKKNVKEELALGFSTCRLSIALAKGDNYQGISSLEGKTIATSFPNLLRDFLEAKGVSANIEYLSGSVEIAPGIGLAQAICDIVSTGSTLVMNGLKEVEEVLYSEATLISRPDLNPEQQSILDKLKFRIEAVRRAKTGKYITLNAPNSALDEIRQILPGLKSPTIIPLADDDWSAVHTVVAEKDFWDRIDRLKDAGAEGILVLPIEKTIL